MLGLTHRPAIELAQRLVELAPDGLSRVFLLRRLRDVVEIALEDGLPVVGPQRAPQRTSTSA